jgi:hypothetical protein
MEARRDDDGVPSGGSPVGSTKSSSGRCFPLTPLGFQRADRLDSVPVENGDALTTPFGRLATKPQVKNDAKAVDTISI